MSLSGVSIYYIHPSRLPTEKAHGGQIARMCTEWAKLGAHVVLMPGFSDRSLAGGDVYAYYGVENNFTVIPIADTSWHARISKFPKVAFYLNNLTVFLRLLWWIPKERDAIIFTRRPEIAWLFKQKGYRVVYECHEWYAHSWRFPYWLATHADLIVTINRYTAEEFEKRGFPKQKLMVETNGVLYEAFAIEATKEEARKKLNLPIDKKILLTAGGLKMMREEKGVTVMLAALKELGGGDMLFVAVGGKPGDIAEYKEKADTFGVGKQCIFIERVDRETLALYQRAVDLLLITHPRTHLFEYYMAPLKTFEYMASGRPIVASDLLSLREILDNDSAYFAEPDNARDVARAIREVLDDEIEAIRRGKNAQEKARHHTWSARAERLLRRFEQFT